MNIDELETQYLTDTQIEELSESEKVHLITRLMAAKEQEYVLEIVPTDEPSIRKIIVTADSSEDAVNRVNCPVLSATPVNVSHDQCGVCSKEIEKGYVMCKECAEWVF